MLLEHVQALCIDQCIVMFLLSRLRDSLYLFPDDSEHLFSCSACWSLFLSVLQTSISKVVIFYCFFDAHLQSTVDYRSTLQYNSKYCPHFLKTWITSGLNANFPTFSVSLPEWWCNNLCESDESRLAELRVAASFALKASKPVWMGQSPFPPRSFCFKLFKYWSSVLDCVHISKTVLDYRPSRSTCYIETIAQCFVGKLSKTWLALFWKKRVSRELRFLREDMSPSWQKEDLFGAPPG